MTYLVRLKPEPRVDGIKALRTVLKVALERFGLRAVVVREEPTEKPKCEIQSKREP